MAVVDVSWLGGDVKRVENRAGPEWGEPDEERGQVTGHHLEYVFPPALLRGHWHRRPSGVPPCLARRRIVPPHHARFQGLGIRQVALLQRCHQPQVDVQRVIVLGEVDHLPHLAGAHRRRLRGRLVVGLAVQQQPCWLAGGGRVLVHDDVAPPRRAARGRRWVPHQQPRKTRGIRRLAPLDRELHNLTVGVVRRIARRVRVRGVVLHHRRVGGRDGEVDDDVGYLGRPQQQLPHPHRPPEVDGVRGHLVEFEPVGEEESEEPGVAGVEYPESVSPPPHVEAWPGFAVHDDGIAEVLGLPLRVNGRVVAGGVQEDGAVGSEAPVEHHQMPVELVAGGQAQRPLKRRLADDVGAEEAGE